MLRSAGIVAQGAVRTVFIFTDLPRHIEFRAGDLPLLAEGTVVEFNVVLKNPRDRTKSRHVEGPHKVQRMVLKFETGRTGLMGLTQYVEWKSAGS
jgi:hypothetical protein